MSSLELQQPTQGVMDDPLVCLSINEQWLKPLMTVIERWEFARTWAAGTDLDFVTENALTYADYLADLDEGACTVDQAPFWDDEDGGDADDVAAAQPWYENVADWVITGFIAVAFTPGAAIAYKTTVPKARVFFRRGQYGASFKALLNGFEMLTGDSYSAIADVLGVTLDFAGFASANGLGAPPWDFRIEHVGQTNPAAVPTPQGYRLEVVRGRLRNRLKYLYGNTAPTVQTLLQDYQDEYGVTVQVIEDMRVVGGQIQVRYLGNPAWVNVTNGEFVRRDASLDPDIAGATRITGEVQTPGVVYGDVTSSRQWRLSVVSAELRLQHAINFTSAPITIGANPAAQGIRIDDIFRSRIAFALQRSTSTSIWRDAARMDAGWDDATDATRRGNLALSVADSSASREIIRGGTSGTAPRVGFLGAAPIARPTVSGADNGNTALRNLIAAMTNYGLITDGTTQSDVPDTSGEQARCRVALGVPRLFLQAAKRLIDAHVAAEPLNLFDDAAYLAIVRAYGVPWRNETAVKEWLQNHDLNCPDQGDPPFVDCALLWDALESAAGNPNLESQMAARLLSVMPSDGYLTEGTITDWNAALNTLTGTVARVRYFFRVLIEFTDPIAWGGWANTANGFAFSDCRELDVSIEFVTPGTTATEGQTLNIPVRLNAPTGFALDRALTFQIAHDPFPAATGQSSDIFIQPGATFAFPAGSGNGATTNATVQIVDDFIPEPNESVRVRLENNTYGAVGAASTHLITILGDDEYPDCGETVSIAFTDGTPGYALIPAQHPSFGRGAAGVYNASVGRTSAGSFMSQEIGGEHVLQFEIDLGKECDVRYLSLWRSTSAFAGGNNFPLGLNMYDAGGVSRFADNTQRPSGSWEQWEWGSPTIIIATDVRYIVVTCVTTLALAPAYLDDITIILA